jgi:hypothetical protein
VDDTKALQALAAAWPKASLEARREFVERLTTEVRFDGDSIELVIRPEPRRMVDALAQPSVELILGHERDDRGRFVPGRTGVRSSTGSVVLTSGRCWIRTFIVPRRAKSRNTRDLAKTPWRAGPQPA